MKHYEYIIVGSGISGLTTANLLKDYDKSVLVLDKSKKGGLIRCEYVDNNLYHMVGGHVFNTKNLEVFEWFKTFFDLNSDFYKVDRNAKIIIENLLIGYPIENNIYQLSDNNLKEKIIRELIDIENCDIDNTNFETFLRTSFGETLYEIYFKPYNEKIWNCELSEISIEWLSGKLPMPNIRDIIVNNILRKSENTMVHSSFYYPKKDGSQFIVDRLSRDLEIIENYTVSNIRKNEDDNIFIINNEYSTDKIIYTGNVKEVDNLFSKPNNIDIENLKYHGTTNVLCKTNIKEDSTWTYIPDKNIKAHRIIFTGNFSENNNKTSDILTATIEYTDLISVENIKEDIKQLPYDFEIISYWNQKYTYPIQDNNTRNIIGSYKESLPENFYLLGRFAEWEYYNMDVCIEKSMELVKRILKI